MDALPATVDPEIVIVGTVTAEGVECPALRTDAGVLYTLTDLPRELAVGERIKVTGQSVRFSICQQGITIVVETIDSAPNG